MSIRNNTFDFSELIGELANFLPTSSDDDAKRFRSALFNKRDFTAFAGHFFSSQVSHDKTQDMLNSYVPAEKKRSIFRLGLKSWFGMHNNYTGFGNDDGPKVHETGVRKADKHPLSHAEFSDAMDFCDENPEYMYAIAGIQACIFEYLTELDATLKSDDRTKHTYPDFRFEDGSSAEFRMRGFLRNAEEPVFMQDLSTTMAAGIAKNGGELSDHALQMSLVDQFRRQTFKSSSWGFDGATKCPFSSFYATVMSVKLSPNIVGGFDASTGVFGDLLRDVMAIAPEIQSNELEFGADDVASSSVFDDLVPTG